MCSLAGLLCACRSDGRGSEVARLQGDAHLKAWCTRTTLRRYAIARQWQVWSPDISGCSLRVRAHSHARLPRVYDHCTLQVDKAAHQLKATFEWRRSYKPHLISWDDVKEEAVTGACWLPAQPHRQRFSSEDLDACREAVHLLVSRQGRPASARDEASC